MNPVAIIAGAAVASVLFFIEKKSRARKSKRFQEQMPELPNDPKLTELAVGMAELSTEVMTQVMDHWPKEQQIRAGLHLAAAAQLNSAKRQLALENVSHALGTNPDEFVDKVNADPADAAKCWGAFYF